MDFLDTPVAEWIGYLAMATVLVSFLMKSITKLRIVNSLGALLFVLYGVLLTPISKPIIITNFVIFGIHIHYLLQKNE